MTPDIDFSDSNFVDDILKNCNNLRTRATKAEASLAEAEALIKKNAELMNSYLARIAELEAQIADLKRIAVEERARYLEDFIHEFDPAENRSLEACHQLAEEHPEAYR